MKKKFLFGLVAIILSFVMIFHATPEILLTTVAETIENVFTETDENPTEEKVEEQYATMKRELSDEKLDDEIYIVEENVANRTLTTKEFCRFFGLFGG